MTDISSIPQRLRTLELQGYSKVVSELLSAYGIVQSTIDRIISDIDNGGYGPYYVYRRAAICCHSELLQDSKIEELRTAYPLLIVLHPTTIVLFNSGIGELTCTYGELVNHLDYLTPLLHWDVNRNDHYSTIELDKLVESLYRALKYEVNEETEIRRFICSLLYIAHFRTLLDIQPVNDCLKYGNSSEAEITSYIFRYFSEIDCPFVVNNINRIKITREAYSYILAIIKFDTELVDAEILTSLIYRMADREKAGLYGHQTSFVNVEKLLQPLFLDRMQAKAATSTNENVYEVVTNIYQTIVFDPTNSPGCFLVSAYNGLAQQLREVEQHFNIKCKEPLDISNFVSLVENQLALDLTRLALTFTHTKELKRLGALSVEKINQIYNSLNVTIGAELSTEWSEIVHPNEHLYIVGSPEFKGRNKLSVFAKEEMQAVFEESVLYNADYCSSWLIKAADLIKNTKARAAFVLTNSVSQGSQASFILDKINELGCEYIFAHRSFKWKTSFSDNTGVTVVIIGIAAKNEVSEKIIFDSGRAIPCKAIGSSLLPDIDIRIKRRKQPISNILPHMRKGNMPDGATALTFTPDEKVEFLEDYPGAKKFFKTLYGGEELVTGRPKWVLWITDEQLSEALMIKGIADRIDLVRQQRTKSGSTSSEKSRSNPHKFRETNCTSKGKVSLVVPCVTSENREYFQIGILDSNAILNNNVSVIFDCDIWLLALLESRMHMVWARNACGGHETRPRYSSEVCYNTFPVPELNRNQIGVLRNLSKTLLEVREKYCNKSLGELYLHMPPELERVHYWIDETVDSYYRNQPFTNDAERLIWMKNLYYKSIENEEYN